jgi:hypothetical protein
MNKKVGDDSNDRKQEKLAFAAKTCEITTKSQNKTKQKR